MRISEALAAIRGWRMKPEAVSVLLAELERLQRELQERMRK